MNERVVSKLGAVWMTTAVISLILPVFLPSYPSLTSHHGMNVIEAATVTMFLLSFPSSLLGLPLVLFSQLSLGIDPSVISGKYFMVVAFFLFDSCNGSRSSHGYSGRKSRVSIFLPSNRVPLEASKTDFKTVPSREKSPVESFIEK